MNYLLDHILKTYSSLPQEKRLYFEQRGSHFDTLIYMHWLLKINYVSSVIEIGTFRGLSACFLATAISGNFYTINISENELHDAKELSMYLGIKNITFLHGDSLDILPNLVKTKTDIDVAYLDGCHSYAYVSAEYNTVLPLLKTKERAAVIFDNADYLHPDGSEDGGVPKIVEELNLSLVENYGIAIKSFGRFDCIL